MQGLSSSVSVPLPPRTVWPPAAPLHPSCSSAPPEPAGIALPLSANPMMDFNSSSFLPPCCLPFMHFPPTALPIPLFCIFVSFTTSLLHPSFTSAFFLSFFSFLFSSCLSTPLISSAAVSAAPILSPDPAASPWHCSRAVLAQDPRGCLSFRPHHSRAVLPLCQTPVCRRGRGRKQLPAARKIGWQLEKLGGHARGRWAITGWAGVGW